MPVAYDTFLTNLERVRAEIAEACASAGRDPHSVELLPVTKNHPAVVLDYVSQAGLKSVGENRVQEAVGKQGQTSALLVWELIGHLQSNKAKLAAEHFGRIQSVDGEKLLQRLAQAAAEQGKKLSILLQINAGRDPAKFGAELEGAPRLLELALGSPSLSVEGLMTIAPLSEDRTVSRRCFANLRELRDRLARDFRVPLPVLSMGMSGDMAEAIAEGSTQVRVGTALFGARS